MRTYEEDEIEKLNAEPWQLDLLKLNPEYVYWGPHEDYMWKEGQGWESRVIVPTWGENKFGLNDLNQCVNFYFSVSRASTECTCCGGNGYNSAAQEVVNSFYSHMNPKGDSWHDKITDDEVLALKEAGRLHNFPKDKTPTAEEVNAAQHQCGLIGHDAINRSILTETRLKRLGIPLTCDKCDGNGYTFTAPSAHVSLTLWIIHPRKGCSRGVEIERVEESDLASIFTWLSTAAERNAQRFSKLPIPCTQN